MNMKSKIKSLFNEELRRNIGAICDTRQIESNQEKMDLLQRLLIRDGIQAEQLGGATNRFVVMIDGYAIKIAVDRQGYKDNLMEYALSPEMQPFVTKSYETNGYILIQECVRILSIEEWRLRKSEIIKILDTLGREYLLGDVGYFDVNMTNWGIRDSGELVILDYAYCHRLTEDLFTCSICGSLLTYDQNFISILCTDRANCHQKYSYNEIKARQGDAVDLAMIADKKASSVVIPVGQDSVYVEKDSDTLLDSRTFVIRNYRDLHMYKEVQNMLTVDCTDQEVLEKMRSLIIARVRGDAEEIERLENELYGDKKEPEAKVRCIVDPEFQERIEEDQMMEEQAMLYGYDYDPEKQYTPKKTDEQEDLSKYTFEALFERLLQNQGDDFSETEDYPDEDNSENTPNDTVSSEDVLGDEEISDTEISESELEESKNEHVTTGDENHHIVVDEGWDDFEGDTICVIPLENSDDKTTEVSEPEEDISESEITDEPELTVPEGFTDEPVSFTDNIDINTDESIPLNIEEVGYEENPNDPEEVIFNDFSLSSGEFMADGDNTDDADNESEELQDEVDGVSEESQPEEDGVEIIDGVRYYPAKEEESVNNE